MTLETRREEFNALLYMADEGVGYMSNIAKDR
jgi:hypothetical protein